MQSSFDDAMSLIRVLNWHLRDFDLDFRDCFAAWREIAGSSLSYLVDVSQAQSHALRSSPSDLLSCDSICAMTKVIFRMYTIESSLFKNVNHFLRYFPISMVSKFMRELGGILSYIYLLQSSIEYHAHKAPIRENLVVYRGIGDAADLVLLYQSMIEDVVVWPGFTSTSTDRNYVLDHFITDDHCMLFEIELHPGDIAVNVAKDSEHELEKEFLIAASTGFKVLSVDDTDISIQGEDGGLSSFRFPIVRVSYFLHWHDFDLDQRPLPVLV
jgi:hypothetical protein